MSEEDDTDIDNDTDEGDEGEGSSDWLPSGEILAHVREIVDEYAADDVTVGLRALYYQFVGRGIVSKEELAVKDKKGNTVGAKRFYKRLGKIIAEARYTGNLPIDCIADEGREVVKGAFTREDLDVEAAHRTAGQWIQNLDNMLMQTEKWVGQPNFVSVWVEKAALSPTIRPVCDELGVCFLACKGYPSVSALWEWVEHADFVINGSEREDGYTYGDGLELVERHVGGHAREAHVIYLGDHDPDGFEIPRSSERGIRRLMETYAKEFPLYFHRIALSRAQVDQYNLPPFEAKMSSARYKGYRKEHNTDLAWELDALDMRVTRNLVQDAIAPLWDANIGRRVQDEAENRKSELRNLVTDPSWFRQLWR